LFHFVGDDGNADKLAMVNICASTSTVILKRRQGFGGRTALVALAMAAAAAIAVHFC